MASSIPQRKKRARTPRGKVLKVRLGYNANSSSLSAVVSLLMLGSAAAVTVLGMIGAALSSGKKKPEPAEAGDGA
jgi:hypothetical protein